METRAPDAKQLSVYYDGSCPICAREIDFYQRRRGADALRWVDASQAPSHLFPSGLDRRKALERFHVVDANGVTFSGARAFIEMWAAFPNVARFVRVLRFRPIVSLMEWGYRLLLWLRPSVQRWIPDRKTGHLMIVLLPLFFSNTEAHGASMKTAHDFSFAAIEGGALPLSDFSGRAVLVVNTASRCGFTRQYGDLQALWSRYRDRGLVVLGVPSNDFGGQEPGTETEIKTFCEVNFDVDFPMTEKVHVSGETAHPFYDWARQELGALAKPRWNFHKYLVAPDGRLVDWFSTPTSPLSKRVIRAVEANLPTLE